MDYVEALSTKLLKQRVILLEGEIDSYKAATLMGLFNLLVAQNSEPIHMLISSPGGDVDGGLAIMQSVRYAQNKGCQVTGEVRGLAMSMAFLILQTTNIREARPDDVIMVHGITGFNFGDLKDQEANVALQKEQMRRHAKFLADRNTSQNELYHTIDYWQKLLDDNHPVYMFSDEALEKGLLDRIL